MSIIKIKQSDIEKIVSNIVNEQSLGDNSDSIAHEEVEVSEDNLKYLRKISSHPHCRSQRANASVIDIISGEKLEDIFLKYTHATDVI